MGFVGRLEDLSLSDIFQVLSLGKRTGKLTLARRKQQGLIVFVNGGIVYCQSTAVHETLGSMLVSRNIITESTLLAALDLQQAGGNRPLGRILIEMGAVAEQVLNDFVREQIKSVISGLMSWGGGTFQFEPMELGDDVSAVLEVSEFLIEDGLRPEEMMLELLTQLDEERQDLSPSDDLNLAQELEQLRAKAVEASPDSEAARGGSRGFASLRSIMTELRLRPFSFTGEITLMLLRYSAELVNRSVLFAVRGAEVIGIGQFGLEIEGESADKRVRQIRIPIAEKCVLTEVCESHEPFRGRLPRNQWNNYLLQQLGGRVPREAIVVPIIVDGDTLAILYGDNLPEETPIGPIEGLELLMIEAGLLLEKHRLEARLAEKD